MTLGEKILFYRKQNKLSQEELAALVGVSRQAVSKWELGEATPEVEKLLALARAFAITTDELLSPDEPKTQKTADPLRYPISTPGEQNARTSSETAHSDQSPSSRGSSTDELRKYGRWLGGLIRRKGYMAGYILSLYGLGPFVIGLIATILFGQMNRAASSMMGSIGDPLSGLDFSDVVISAEGPILDAGVHMTNGVSSMMSIPQTFAAIVMIIGFVMIISGIILAQTLKEKWKNKD